MREVYTAVHLLHYLLGIEEEWKGRNTSGYYTQVEGSGVDKVGGMELLNAQSDCSIFE